MLALLIGRIYWSKWQEEYPGLVASTPIEEQGGRQKEKNKANRTISSRHRRLIPIRKLY